MDIEKDFPTMYAKAIQLVKIYHNIKEMANNRRVNDLPINENMISPDKVTNELKSLANKRPIKIVEKKMIEYEIRAILTQTFIPMHLLLCEGKHFLCKLKISI